jgi:hypothetical protein
MDLNPHFVSDIDLHVTNDSLNCTGGPRLLLTDFDGSPRFDPTDMGCYEWSRTVSNFHTLAATEVTQTTATLNGDITTRGEYVNVNFEYGTSTSYGSTAPAVPLTVRSVTDLLAFSANLTGLLPGTTYHYRMVGDPITSGQLNVYGEDMTFTTGSSVPVNITASGTVAGDTCINALQVITVGGNPPTFTVTPTGHVNLIAGQQIRILPGSVVQAGGYLHGTITTTAQYCGAALSPMVATTKSADGSEEPTGKILPATFGIYPNPTNGNFTLAIRGEIPENEISIEIYSMTGKKIATGLMVGAQKHEFTISDMPAGIYFVKVISGDHAETMKLVKTK